MKKSTQVKRGGREMDFRSSSRLSTCELKFEENFPATDSLCLSLVFRSGSSRAGARCGTLQRLRAVVSRSRKEPKPLPPRGLG